MKEEQKENVKRNGHNKKKVCRRVVYLFGSESNFEKKM